MDLTETFHYKSSFYAYLIYILSLNYTLALVCLCLESEITQKSSAFSSASSYEITVRLELNKNTTLLSSKFSFILCFAVGVSSLDCRDFDLAWVFDLFSQALNLR
uniref:Uncharacterized protein n=1 Tax=Noccaea caerulescens TaxID=107243 RepID=A0A1J3HA75_NOCCA